MTTEVSREYNSGDGFLEGIPPEGILFQQIMYTNELVWYGRCDRQRIENWLANFQGEVAERTLERRLALWLLANFVYYNQDEVRHLCRVVYLRFLHRVIVGGAGITPGSPMDERSLIAETMFCHLGRTSESGEMVSYFFRQENGLPTERFFRNPEELDDSVRRIVFVDDVALTGEQAALYLRHAITQRGDREVFLLTFIATEDAKDLLAKGKIEVISPIILDDRSHCFDKVSGTFVDCRSQMDVCKRMASHYGAKLRPKSPLGYKDCGYAFGFFYNTPDNSLPIFWCGEQGWQPVMRRYDKKYGRQIKGAFRGHEPYI